MNEENAILRMRTFFSKAQTDSRLPLAAVKVLKRISKYMNTFIYATATENIPYALHLLAAMRQYNYNIDLYTRTLKLLVIRLSGSDFFKKTV
jgi:nitrate reductase beta subunit